MDNEQLWTTLAVRVVQAIASIDGSDVDIWWCPDDHDPSQIRPIINCSDRFAWATADAEEITHDNVSAFEQAKKDMQAAAPDGDWALLFVARQRGIRPMPKWFAYARLSPAERELFEACGPERCCNDCLRPKSNPCLTRVKMVPIDESKDVW